MRSVLFGFCFLSAPVAQLYLGMIIATVAGLSGSLTIDRVNVVQHLAVRSVEWRYIAGGADAEGEVSQLDQPKPQSPRRILLGRARENMRPQSPTRNEGIFSMMTRREFSAGMFAASAGAQTPNIRLIAHRGGVVDAGRPENSPGAVQAAIDRGYWMIEVDVRKTKDGEPVLHHDPVLTKYYADARSPEELTWQELRRLKSTPGGKPPLHFEELCGMCAGKMRLMLDLKGQWEPAFYQRLLRLMLDGKVPGPIYSLGGPKVWPYFEGRVMVSLNRKGLAAAVEAGEPVGERYFLFELGSDIHQETFDLAMRSKVVPIAAINTFRYTMAKRDEWEGPKEDILRLRTLGVRDYQVDSRYEPLFA
jgi:glycerophosphoryl diester phosphodiesterase